MKHIHHCNNCSEFTMNEKHHCGAKTELIRPQRYSPGRFAEYRRKARKEMLEQKGLL